MKSGETEGNTVQPKRPIFIGFLTIRERSVIPRNTQIYRMAFNLLKNRQITLSTIFHKLPRFTGGSTGEARSIAVRRSRGHAKAGLVPGLESANSSFGDSTGCVSIALYLGDLVKRLPLHATLGVVTIERLLGRQGDVIEHQEDNDACLCVSALAFTRPGSRRLRSNAPAISPINCQRKPCRLPPLIRLST